MIQNKLKTELVKKHPKLAARVTKVSTPHGEIMTPAFMPVATRAFVNHMTPEDLVNAGSQIILGGNTYHMLLAPGTEVIEAAGGMHPFMNWHGPMLTDSGGFQIFSLSKNSKICKIDEEGATFKHPDSGKVIRMTPESSLETQKIIGADIIMAFDQCTPDIADRPLMLNIMERTHRWLQQSCEYQAKYPNSKYGYPQALFGIIQGGYYRDLREKSMEFILSMDTDGIAIGGEMIGYDMDKTTEVLDWIVPNLPEHKTRYTMGVGLTPQNLIDVVKEGIDIFDCVAPTRNARHGTLYCGEIVNTEDGWIKFESEHAKGKIEIKKSKYAQDQEPIMKDCDCYTCKNYTRSYMHYLFKSKSFYFGHLAAIHNIHVMHKVCEAMRECILAAS